MSAFRKLIARLTGSYGSDVATEVEPVFVPLLTLRSVHWVDGTGLPVCLPLSPQLIAALRSSPSTLGAGDDVHHGHQVGAGVPVTCEGCVDNWPFGIWRSLLGSEQRAFRGIYDGGQKLYGFVVLEDEPAQHVGHQRFEEHDAASQVGKGFFVGHVILRGLIARMKAFLRGRVE